MAGWFSVSQSSTVTTIRSANWAVSPASLTLSVKGKWYSNDSGEASVETTLPAPEITTSLSGWALSSGTCSMSRCCSWLGFNTLTLLALFDGVDLQAARKQGGFKLTNVGAEIAVI